MKKTWTNEDRLRTRTRQASLGRLRQLLAMETWVHYENDRRAAEDWAASKAAREEEAR